MEIIIHIINVLNQNLNLGLYMMADGHKLILRSLVKNYILIELPAKDSLNFYTQMNELKRLVSSWQNYSIMNNRNMMENIRNQIHLKYKFDIQKHSRL